MIDRVWQALADTGVNLYDFALLTPQGAFSHRFQPCSNCHDGYSVAKAFVMTAIGLLYDDGLLSPTDRLDRFLRVPESADERWHEVTLEHLLTHRCGIDKPFLDIDCDDLRDCGDYLSLVWEQPLPHRPATHEQYSDAVFYLLSRVVGAVSGQTTDALLQARLFTPLRFGETAWSRCPQGHPIGGSGFYARADDVVKLGRLYLHEGEYDGRRLLSAQWVRMALERGYELHPFGSADWIGKGGMYGQGVAFCRRLGVAAAWHAFETDGREGAVLDALNQALSA